MLTAQQNLEMPMWQELARAVINRGAIDYIVALMVLNGEKVPHNATNVAIHAHPDRVIDDCETFFFSGWFRLLSADTGLDGMRLASTIESDWRGMYDRMRKAKSGRQTENPEISETQRARQRQRALERYYRKKAEKAAKGGA